MDFEAAEPGDLDEIMAPREDLLVYDEEDVLEDDPQLHSAQQDHRGQPAASEEEGLFRCVAKTAVTADGDTPLCPHYLAPSRLQHQKDRLTPKPTASSFDRVFPQECTTISLAHIQPHLPAHTCHSKHLFGHRL